MSRSIPLPDSPEPDGRYLCSICAVRVTKRDYRPSGQCCVDCYRAKDETEKTALRSLTSGAKAPHGLKREYAGYQADRIEADARIFDEIVQKASTALEEVKRQFGMGMCKCCSAPVNFVEPNEFGDFFCPMCEFPVVRCGQCTVHDCNVYPEVSARVPALPIEQIPTWLLPKKRTISAKVAAVIAANKAFVENEIREKELAIELAKHKEAKAEQKARLRVLESASDDSEKDE